MHAFWKGSKKTSTFEHQSWKQSMESWVVKPLIIFKIHSPVLGPVHVQRGKATFIYIQKTAWSTCFNILILHLIFSFILSVDDCKLVICISHVSHVCSAFFYEIVNSRRFGLSLLLFKHYWCMLSVILSHLSGLLRCTLYYWTLLHTHTTCYNIKFNSGSTILSSWKVF